MSPGPDKAPPVYQTSSRPLACAGRGHPRDDNWRLACWKGFGWVLTSAPSAESQGSPRCHAWTPSTALGMQDKLCLKHCSVHKIKVLLCDCFGQTVSHCHGTARCLSWIGVESISKGASASPISGEKICGLLQLSTRRMSLMKMCMPVVSLGPNAGSQQ